MNAVARLAKLPDWPGRMNADIAALYMGIGRTTFLERFGAIGVGEGANKLWARAQLDQLIAHQFNLPQKPALPAAGDDSWDDLR